jgi:colicin import membrane protein
MTENALALIETKTGNSLIESFQTNGLDQLIENYRNRALSFKGDISTKTGRDEIRSYAASIGKDKAQLERLGKQSVEDLQKTVKAVTAERMRGVAALQEIQDTVRKPLTDWEDAEKTRTADHEAAIASISLRMELVDNIDVHEIERRIAEIIEIGKSRNWEEFSQRAQDTHDTAYNFLIKKLEAKKKHDAEQAELARLRKEEADRKQREHEEKLQAEAADKARKEAEAEAKRKADEEAARVKAEQEKLEQERLKAEREKQAEKERADKAERDRIASEEKAKKDAQEAKEKSERDAKLAKEKAEREKEEAIRKERTRVEAENKRIADETAKREADKVHRTKINNEILTAILPIIHGHNSGRNAESHEIAKDIITAIAKGALPHVKINY